MPTTLFFTVNTVVAYVLTLAFFLLPPFIGFGYIRLDADKNGQPGWLWAVATLALSWLAILAYLIVRYLSPTRSQTPQ